jgi:hypothetical protein
MIGIAAILSAAITHGEDFAIILLLLMTNAVVGFLQERKAENAIELLKKQLAPNARVLREGTGQEIPAHELMPGDMIHIRLGDIMPADTVPGKGRYLRPDGSALTGESLPVGMKTGDTACSGSIARQGGMDERVTTIRENTFFFKERPAGQGKISAKPCSGNCRADCVPCDYTVTPNNCSKKIIPMIDPAPTTIHFKVTGLILDASFPPNTPPAIAPTIMIGTRDQTIIPEKRKKTAAATLMPNEMHCLSALSRVSVSSIASARTASTITLTPAPK